MKPARTLRKRDKKKSMKEVESEEEFEYQDTPPKEKDRAPQKEEQKEGQKEALKETQELEIPVKPCNQHEVDITFLEATVVDLQEENQTLKYYIKDLENRLKNEGQDPENWKQYYSAKDLLYDAKSLSSESFKCLEGIIKALRKGLLKNIKISHSESIPDSIQQASRCITSVNEGVSSVKRRRLSCSDFRKRMPDRASSDEEMRQNNFENEDPFSFDYEKYKDNSPVPVCSYMEASFGNLCNNFDQDFQKLLRYLECAQTAKVNSFSTFSLNQDLIYQQVYNMIVFLSKHRELISQINLLKDQSVEFLNF
ncbi:unnamed protein product [Moneuplotes crassus]|uniref:Uncharacterized protein n=1 Tax=Euplotes crassus TaxID=5936 RepID=A0AAD1XKY6_EUPCR|nr:unnamed protein product [Moneuplotes crassus]